jgi:uncharacterized membrane protein
MNKSFTPWKIRCAVVALVILCIIGVSLITHSNVQSGGAKVGSFQIAGTPGAIMEETPFPIDQHEPDVTVGIVLVGSLLMVVIIFGTIHATRGLRKPPHKP